MGPKFDPKFRGGREPWSVSRIAFCTWPSLYRHFRPYPKSIMGLTGYPRVIIVVAGFSLRILKHASGTPCLAQIGVLEWKICVRYQNMTSHHGLTKRVAAPIATSEFEIGNGLFKLTKRSDKLCNVCETLICKLVYLFNVFGEHGRYIGNINHLWWWASFSPTGFVCVRIGPRYNCLNVSIRLVVFGQYFVYHSICPNCLQFFAKQSGILCSVYASSCDVQKEPYTW